VKKRRFRQKLQYFSGRKASEGENLRHIHQWQSANFVFLTIFGVQDARKRGAFLFKSYKLPQKKRSFYVQNS